MEHRSGWLLGTIGAAIILISLGAFALAPFRSCADCEGSGIELVGVPGSERSACGRCLGRGRISLARKWTTKSKVTYVGATSWADYTRFVTPTMTRESIPLVPGDSDLGIVGIYSDSPPNAVRARKILEREAKLKGYRFH